MHHGIRQWSDQIYFNIKLNSSCHILLSGNAILSLSSSKRESLLRYFLLQAIIMLIKSNDNYKYFFNIQNFMFSFLETFHFFKDLISSNHLIVSAKKFWQKSFVFLDKLNYVWTEFSLNYWIIAFVSCFVIAYNWIVHLKGKLCWENLKWKK